MLSTAVANGGSGNITWNLIWHEMGVSQASFNTGSNMIEADAATRVDCNRVQFLE
jgi:hypothetical protein